MILPINDQYQIAGDEHCYSIQRAKIRKGNKEWQSFLYYNSLQGAVNGLVELGVRTCDTQTLSEALAEVEKLTATLVHALSPQFEIKHKAALRVVK